MENIKTILYNGQNVNNISFSQYEDTYDIDTLYYDKDKVWKKPGTISPDRDQPADTSDVYLTGIDAQGNVLAKTTPTYKEEGDVKFYRVRNQGPMTMLVRTNGKANIEVVGDVEFSYVESLGYIVSNTRESWTWKDAANGGSWMNGWIKINNRQYDFWESSGYVYDNHKYLIDTEYTTKVIKLPHAAGQKQINLNFYMQGFDDTTDTEPSAIRVLDHETGTYSSLSKDNASYNQSITNGMITQYPTISIMPDNSSVYVVTIQYTENNNIGYRDVCLEIGGTLIHLVQEPSLSTNNKIYYSVRSNKTMVISGIEHTYSTGSYVDSKTGQTRSYFYEALTGDIYKAPYSVYDLTLTSPNQNEFANNSPVVGISAEYNRGYGLFNIGNVVNDLDTDWHVSPGRFLAIPSSWEVQYEFNSDFKVNGYDPQTTDSSANGYWTPPRTTWDGISYTIYDTEGIYNNFRYKAA